MKNANFLLSIITIYIMSSCAPTLYSPTVVSVPMLEHEGEGHATISTNFEPKFLESSPFRNLYKGSNNKGYFDQFDINGSYAITDKIGLQANFTSVKPRDMNPEQYGSGYMGELGGGYYKRLSPYWIFETYGLIGLGSAENHFTGSPEYGIDRKVGPDSRPDTSYHISANTMRFGIQPSITFKKRKFFTSLAVRASNLNFFNVKGGLVFDEADWGKLLREQGKNNWIFETALTIGVDIDQFRLQLQGGTLGNFGKVDLHTEGGFGSVGIGYNFRTKAYYNSHSIAPGL